MGVDQSTGEDGSPSSNAKLSRPSGITYDASTKRLYFSEEGAHRVRYITVLDHLIYHYAGARNGSFGDITGPTPTSDNSSSLHSPRGLDIANGILYIAGTFVAHN